MSDTTRAIEMRLKANFAEFNSGIDTATQKATKFGDKVQEASKKVVSSREAATNAAKKVVAAEGALVAAQAREGATSEEVVAAQVAVVSAHDAAAKAALRLTAAEEAYQVVSGNTASSVAKLSGFIQAHRAELSTLSTTMTLVGGAGVAMGVMALKSSMDFEHAMSNIKATGPEAIASIDELRATVIRAGADTMYSATEAAGAVTELAKAGMSVADITGGGLAGALSLAAAGSMDLKEAAEDIATALAQFNLQGYEASHVADLLAAGAGNAQGEVSDMANALKQGGLVAYQTGLSVDETVGALTAFAKAGLLGSDAGTSLKTMLQRLTPQSLEAAAMFDKLDINAYDAGGKFVGLANLSGELASKLADLTPEARNSALAVMFGSDAVRGASVLYSLGKDKIQAYINTVNDAGYAARVAATKTDNFAGDLERLGGSIETVTMQAGSGLNVWLRDAAKNTTNLVNAIGNLPAPLLSGATSIVTLGGVLLLGTGLVMKGTIAWSEYRAAMIALQTTSPGVATAVSRVGKAATAAVAAFAVFKLYEVFTAGQRAEIDKHATSIADYAASVGRLGQVGSFDALDKQWKKINGDTTDFGKSIGAVNAIQKDFWLNAGFGTVDFFKNIWGDKGQLASNVEEIQKMDSALSSMSTESAQAGFAKLTTQMRQYKMSNEDILAKFPEYKGKFDAISTQLGVTTPLSAKEYVDWMGGKVPDAVKIAAAVHPELVGQLDSSDAAMLQLTADMKTYAEQLFSSSKAQFGYINAEVGFREAVLDSDEAMKKTRRTHNLHTRDGIANVKTMEQMATSGQAWVASLLQQYGVGKRAERGMAQVRSEFIKTARASGYSKTEANKLADAYGLIPKNVKTKIKVETDNAATQLAIVQAAIQGLPPDKQVEVLTAFKSGGLDEANRKLHEIDPSKTITIYTDHIDRKGTMVNGHKVYKAAGGAIYGAGTSTSDSIPAMLSNGEHVLKTSTVNALGGQDAVYRLTAMADAGMLQFADGGAVDHFAKGGSAKASAAKRKAAAKKAAAAAKEKREARAELKADLAKSVRRGDITDDVTSGGYSTVDELLDWAKDTNLSKAQRKKLTALAAKAESKLAAIYTKLDTANKKVDELQGIYDNVQSGLSGGVDWSSAMEATYTEHSDGKGNVWQSANAVTGASIASAAKAKADTLKVFASKLAALAQKGASPRVIQEIADLGAEDGIRAADAFLTDNVSLQNMNSAYAEIDTYSKQAAQSVTEASYDGGLAAAKVMVEQLTASATSWGEKMAEGLAAALGLKIKGGVLTKRAGGGQVRPYTPTLVGEREPEVLVTAQSGWILNQAQAQQALRNSVVNTSSASSFSIGSLSVVVGDPETKARVERIQSDINYLARRARAGVK